MLNGLRIQGCHCSASGVNPWSRNFCMQQVQPKPEQTKPIKNSMRLLKFSVFSADSQVLKVSRAGLVAPEGHSTEVVGEAS